MKKSLKIILIISIIGAVGSLGYFLGFPVYLDTIEDPVFELPISDVEEATGIQVFHDPSSTQLHNGYDFKLENDTEIIAPIAGEISRISKHRMSNDYWIIDVFIKVNIKWSMFIAFEPWTQDESVINDQMENITVQKGDTVSVGDQMGILNPVPDSEFPHIHWNIIEYTPAPGDDENRNPYFLVSTEAKDDMDYLCAKFSRDCTIS